MLQQIPKASAVTSAAKLLLDMRIILSPINRPSFVSCWYLILWGGWPDVVRWNLDQLTLDSLREFSFIAVSNASETLTITRHSGLVDYFSALADKLDIIAELWFGSQLIYGLDHSTGLPFTKISFVAQTLCNDAGLASHYPIVVGTSRLHLSYLYYLSRRLRVTSVFKSLWLTCVLGWTTA
jgi:hypothetical protein